MGKRNKSFIILGISIVLLLTLLKLSFAACNPGITPPISGDWKVNETTDCSNMVITLNGNLTINNSASLTLQNVTLNLSPTYNGSIGINVSENSTGMFVYDSTIQSNTSYNYFWFVNASFVMERSNVSRAGYSGRYGISIYKNGTIVNSTTIKNSFFGLVFYSSYNNVTNSFLINNGWYPLYIGSSAYPSSFNNFYSITIYDNDRGIRIQNDSSTNNFFENLNITNTINWGYLHISDARNTILNNSLINVSTDKPAISIDLSSKNISIYNTKIFSNALTNNVIDLSSFDCYVTNVSVNRSKIGISSGNITFLHYVFFNVTNHAGAALMGVNVSLFYNNSGVYSWLLNTTTDSFGISPMLTIIEGVAKQGYTGGILNVSYTPHNVTFNKSLYYFNNSFFYINHTGTYSFGLSPVDITPPVITNLSPEDGNYSGIPDVAFYFNATDNSALILNCSIYINNILNKTNESVVNNTLSSFVITGLADGTYLWNITCSDQISTNTTLARNITVDTTSPLIYSFSSNATRNFSKSGASLNFTVRINETNTKNVTLNGTLMLESNATSFYLLSTPSSLGCTAEGICSLEAKITDKTWKTSITGYNLTIDDTAPIINLESTFLNTSLKDINLSFNATDSLSPELNCSLYINSVKNQTNTSTKNNTATYFPVANIQDGNYTWNIACTDIAGNTNTSQVQNLTIEITAPFWGKNLTSPQSGANYNETQSHQFNITWNTTSAIATIYFEHNFTGVPINDTPIGNTGNEYYFTYPALGAGSYYWKSYATDINNLSNSTEIFTYTINKAAPLLSINITPNDTIAYASALLVNCTSPTAQVTPSLFRNATPVPNPYTDSFLSPGLYNISCNSTETQNYTEAISWRILNITKANSSLALKINGTQGNYTINVNGTVNISLETGTNSQGYSELYINSTLINWGAPNLSNTTQFTQAAYYNITAMFYDSENYSASNITYKLRVNTPPVLDNIADYSVDEESTLIFSINASDADNDTLAYSISGIPINATFIGKTFSWTPSATQSGPYSVTFIVNDTFAVDSKTITIFVGNTADPPPIIKGGGGGGGDIPPPEDTNDTSPPQNNDTEPIPQIQPPPEEEPKEIPPPSITDNLPSKVNLENTKKIISRWEFIPLSILSFSGIKVTKAYEYTNNSTKITYTIKNTGIIPYKRVGINISIPKNVETNASKILGQFYILEEDPGILFIVPNLSQSQEKEVFFIIQNKTLQQSEIDSITHEVMVEISDEELRLLEEMANETHTFIGVSKDVIVYDDKTAVAIGIFPENTAENVTVYLEIPKCLAETLKDINFDMKDYKVIEDDPLIAFTFATLSERTNINFEVLKPVDPDCWEKVKALPIAEKIGDRIIVKDQSKLYWAIGIVLGINLLVLGFNYLQKKAKEKRPESFLHKIEFGVVETILLAIIFLSVLEFLQLLSPDLSFAEKTLSWALLLLLLFEINIENIFYGAKSKVQVAFFLLANALLMARVFVDFVFVSYNEILEKHLSSTVIYLYQEVVDFEIAHPGLITNFCFVAGFSMLVILAFLDIFKNVKAPSLFAALHIEGKPSSLWQCIKRFFTALFVYLAFFIIFFNFFMEWLAITVDASIVVLAIIVYVIRFAMKHYRHYRETNLISKIGNAGEMFYEKFINLFRYRYTILFGLSGILLLHMLVDIGNYIVPFVANVQDALYFSQIGTVHLSLLNILQRLYVDSFWYNVMITTNYCLNVLFVIICLLFPGYLWYDIYKNHTINMKRGWLAVFFAAIINFALGPLIRMTSINAKNVLGVDLVFKSMLPQNYPDVFLLSIVGGIIVYTASKNLTTRTMLKLAGSVILLMFSTAYVFFYAKSWVVSLLPQIKDFFLLETPLSIFLGVLMSTFLIITLLFYATAYLYFVKLVHSEWFVKKYVASHLMQKYEKVMKRYAHSGEQKESILKTIKAIEDLRKKGVSDLQIEEKMYEKGYPEKMIKDLIYL